MNEIRPIPMKHEEKDVDVFASDLMRGGGGGSSLICKGVEIANSPDMFPPACCATGSERLEATTGSRLDREQDLIGEGELYGRSGERLRSGLGCFLRLSGDDVWMSTCSSGRRDVAPCGRFGKRLSSGSRGILRSS